MDNDIQRSSSSNNRRDRLLSAYKFLCRRTGVFCGPDIIDGTAYVFPSRCAQDRNSVKISWIKCLPLFVGSHDSSADKFRTIDLDMNNRYSSINLIDATHSLFRYAADFARCSIETYSRRMWKDSSPFCRLSLVIANSYSKMFLGTANLKYTKNVMKILT